MKRNVVKCNLALLKKNLENLLAFMQTIDLEEYDFFYRQVERMLNNVEICILLKYDGWEQMEDILLRDWYLVKEMYERVRYSGASETREERECFVYLLTSIEGYITEKEEMLYTYEIIPRIFPGAGTYAN